MLTAASSVPRFCTAVHLKQYVESMEFEFSPLVPGIYQAEIEVSMP
ncbi:hypothetical protein [Paenibacillus sp. HJGM_3]